MKSKITHKSRELFLKNGFKTTTMDEVAQQMGVSKKTLYEFFSKKDKLVESVVQDLLDEIEGLIKVIHKQESNPIDEMIAIHVQIRQLLVHESTPSFYQLKKYYHGIFEKCENRIFSISSKYMLETLNKGVELNMFRKNLNVQLAVASHSCVMSNISEEKYATFMQKNSQEIKSDYFKFFMQSICTPDGIRYLEQKLKQIEF